ncbi:MAG: L-fucose:H+ symporter permease [Cyclobacteriaceae bacterium]|nr:L-fucose:H+ symporter permease [Cyclobacteriaceae bacterium]
MAGGFVSTNAPLASSGDNKNYSFALSVLTSLFFMWGFITCLNDILIPHLKAVFTLNYAQAMLIQFCFFTAYFIMSLPSGYIVERVGYKRGIVLGLIVAGIGCLMFYPAASVRSYGLFLTAFFVLASGITLLQVAANPYVTILGKPETASSRLNLTQAFNSLGTTIAPIFGSMLILSVAVKSAEEIAKLNAEELSAYQLGEAAAVQNPYVLLALVLFAIATMFAIIKLPVIEAATPEVSSTAAAEERSSAWKYPHLILGAIGIFVYVGAEVSIGSFLVNFLGEKNIAGLAEADAGRYVSFYWGGAMIGRFVGAAILQRLNAGKVLAGAAAIAALLVVITMLSSGSIAMWLILSVGLFNSVMFPSIFSLGVAGLGKHTGQGSGILCMAIVGGALIPLLQGVLADNIGIQKAFFIPVLCYVYIMYFGWKGHKAA